MDMRLLPLGAVLKLPKDSAKVKTVRVYEDGDFVFAHTEYDLFGPKIGFDVFRFGRWQDRGALGQLATPKGPNPSKHTIRRADRREGRGQDGGQQEARAILR